MNKLFGGKRVDLHLHTNASDGTWSPQELIKEAKNADIGIISVTDHDTVDNVSEAQGFAANEGIRFTTGVEVSTTLNGVLLHILAYGIDINNNRLQELLRYNRDANLETDNQLIYTLAEAGYEICLEEYKNYQYDKTRGGWKALNFLLDKGICSYFKDFFSLSYNGKVITEDAVYFPPKEVLEIIRAAGGIPILAHPAGTSKQMPLDDKLKTLTDLGIRGFECYHPNHSADATKECINWCKSNNLIITAGSDCHGMFVKERHIGVPEAFDKDLDLKEIADKFI